MTDRIEAAKAYAARGWRVIQVHGINSQTGIGCTCSKGTECRSAGKHPVDKAWQQAEPMTADEIESAWSGWRAGHNVGIATGTPSGMFVLDIDPDNGGLEGMKELQAKYGALTASCATVTGSGGWHLLFKMPEDFEPTNRKGGLKEYAGLDVRGTGGQIVAPPSSTPKGSYRWLTEGEPGDAPDWLLDLLRPAATPPPAAPAAAVDLSSVTDAEQLRLERYAQTVRDLEVARLTKMRDASVPEGQTYVGEPWNETTFHVACSLIELANSTWTLYDLAAARSDLLAHAPRDSGFTDEDVEIRWASALNKVDGFGRPYPSAAPMSSDIASEWLADTSIRRDSRFYADSAPEGAVLAADPEDAPTMPQRSWDDLGNAMRMVDHYGSVLRWVTEAQKWALFDHGVWTLVEPNIVQGLVQVMVDQLVSSTEAMNYSNVLDDPDKPDSSERAGFLKWLKAQRMSARIEAAQKEARGRRELHAKMADFDTDPFLLNVRNGVIDLRNGELLPHDSTLLLSRQVPIDYDKQAQAPLWQSFLERVQPSGAMRAYLQRVSGYSLTGSIEEQSIFNHTGDGANGKSIWSGLMSAICGDYAGTVAPTVLLAGNDEQHPTGWAAMAGKRFLPAQETAPGKRLDESKIKEFTGGQAVAARFMGKDFFSYVPVGKIHLITNHLPILSGDAAIWRRIHLIVWGVTIPQAEQDRRLEQKLRSELPGILAWAVQGCMAWQEDGLNPPAEALEAIAVWRGDSDGFGEFLRERTMPSPDTRTPTKPLFDAYTSWCFDQNIKAMSQPSFVQAMIERKYERYRDARSRGFVGVVPVPRQVSIEAPAWDAA